MGKLCNPCNVFVMWFSCFDSWWTLKLLKMDFLLYSILLKLHCAVEPLHPNLVFFVFQINWSIKCSFMDWNYSSEARKILYKNPHKHFWCFWETCFYRTTTINPQTFRLPRQIKPLKNPLNHLKICIVTKFKHKCFCYVLNNRHFCETWFHRTVRIVVQTLPSTC